MFLEIMEQFGAGRYQPLPLKAFAAAETVGAFRYMAQRKNIGKVVVSMLADAVDGDGEAGRGRYVPTAPTSSPAASARWACRRPAG